MSEANPTRRYIYKVLTTQMPREFRYVEARDIEEAEQAGIVVLMVGPADAAGRASQP